MKTIIIIVVILFLLVLLVLYVEKITAYVRLARMRLYKLRIKLDARLKHERANKFNQLK